MRHRRADRRHLSRGVGATGWLLWFVGGLLLWGGRRYLALAEYVRRLPARQAFPIVALVGALLLTVLLNALNW